MSIKQYTILVFEIPISILLIFSYFWLSNLSDEFTIEGFRILDGQGNIEIDVSDGTYEVAISSSPRQRRDIGERLTALITDRDFIVGTTDSNGKIQINLDSEEYNHASIVAFLQCTQLKCEQIGYVELLRQSSENLNDLFGIEKENGYIILGRYDMALSEPANMGVLSPQPIVQPLENDFPLAAGPYSSQPRAGIEAMDIVRFMWSEPVRTGPISDHTAAYLGPLDQLAKVRDGSYSAQCGTFRDIFMGLVVESYNIVAVRAVDLYQALPVFPDLLPNGHSIVEIFDADQNTWIALDPWNAYAFEYDGRLVGAEELGEMGHLGRRKVQIISLTERQRYLDNDVDEEQWNRVSANVFMNDGYMDYFEHISYGKTYSNNNMGVK